MPLSPIDLYRDLLPQTDCGDCGLPTCLALATKVVSEQWPLSTCPHLDPEARAKFEQQLQAQYGTGKWLKRDTAEDALQWAKERSASMRLQDLPARLGGTLVDRDGEQAVYLPYVGGDVLITEQGMVKADHSQLSLWEQVLLYNHLAQGGEREPSGEWKGFAELPNTVSKVKTMHSQVQAPLVEHFQGRAQALAAAGRSLGGEDRTDRFGSADVALYIPALPRVPILLMFWDADQEEGFSAQASLLFDATVLEHLDIESIVFLSEQLRELLIQADPG